MKSRTILKTTLILMVLLSVFTFLNQPSQKVEAYNIHKMEGIIGWDGDKDAPIPRMDGSLYIRDGKNIDIGFGIYNNPATVKWYNDWGYLPCLITEFTRNNCTVKINHFADKATINGYDYVLVYSRVYITNNGSAAVTLDPQANSAFIRLNNNSYTVQPGQTVEHDYVIAADRFGGSYAWPTTAQLQVAGDRNTHWTHMKDYWVGKLNGIVNITQLPDTRLINAFKAGYIYTHIIKDGNSLLVGENGYDTYFDHDAIGIMATLLTLGDFTSAKAYMDQLVGAVQYSDARWKFSWPFALYLMKTGDSSYINTKFNDIKSNTHYIESDRTGPDGIMKMTNDIDSNGYWTIDDCSALFGLMTYKDLCNRIGNSTEANWANNLYNTLLTSVNNKLTQTMNNNGLNYIPVSMTQPNTANRCNEPRDANWAAHFLFGRWKWDGYLFGANQSGILLDKIDASYDYGFGRLAGILPAHDFGGYPHGFFSSSYNAGYGSGALRGTKYRDEGIRAYQFMLDQSQTSPYGWWEGIWYPDSTVPWEGTHPGDGGGSCPHMWGQSTATKVLLDSIIAEKSDGKVIIGRGVPYDWVANGKVIELSNYPIATNKRMGVKIEGLDKAVRITLTGNAPAGGAWIDLPIFINNIASTTAGTIDNGLGRVTITSGTTSVTVTLTNYTPPSTTTYYRIKNRWTGDYMHLENQNGTVQYGPLQSGWLSMMWSIENTNDGSNCVRIKNRYTSNYLHIENLTGYVQYGALNPNWWSMMWTLEDTGDGYKRIKCRWPQHPDYMHLENKLGYVQSGAAQSGWLSAMWALETVN